MHSLNSHATGPGDLEPASAKKNLVVVLVIEVVGECVVVSIIRAELNSAPTTQLGATLIPQARLYSVGLLDALRPDHETPSHALCLAGSPVG